MHRTLIAAALAALSVTPALAQQPPSSAPAPAGANLPPPPNTVSAAAQGLVFDTLNDDVGLAQQATRQQHLQGRILWMDAGANVGNLNTAAKITDIVGRAKAAGFNMIVLDVKPIVGDTIYPSKFAPKLTEWKGQTVPADFDVLRHILDAAHAQGLTVYANMSTFGEGHKYVKRGLAYTHPDWQTVMYEVNRGVSYGPASARISVMDDLPADENTLAAATTIALLKKDRPGYTVAVLNFDARVKAVYDGATLSQQNITVPLRGAVLLGKGAGGRWLQQNALPGRILTWTATPTYTPIVDVPDQRITMFVNPLNPEVRQHELDIVREVVTNYDVDGMVFDDRLRYAAVNADFSPASRAAFEQYVGHALTWPDDVLKTSPYPGQDPQFGPAYQQWLNWRAGVIKSWVADAGQVIRTVRPGAQMAVYAGSWYGDYEKVGSNWAAPDFTAPYKWLTPEYQQTGYGGLLDWITTGCYYELATVHQAQQAGNSLGATVEAAGQLSNRVINDSAWTYAGLDVETYRNDPDAFARAIQGAAASSQGVMIFDLSHIVQRDWWHVLADAFAAAPAQAPNTVPGLLAQVRQQHATQRAAGVPQPPLPPYQGVENTGF